MDGNLTDVLGIALMLLPYMLDAAAEEHKVIVADDLYAVTDNAAVAFAVLHEIQFILLVFMERIGVLFLVTFHKMIAITLGKLGDFGDDVVHFYWI